MKNQIITGAILSIFLIGGATANEMPFGGFVGLTAGGAQVMYDDAWDSEFMPAFHGKVGVNAGVKFGDTNNIWNIGVTGFYDFVVSGEADKRASSLDSISVGYTMFGATLDNTVRVYAKQGASLYLLGGVGYASMTQAVTIEDGGESEDVTESDAGLVAKIGGIYNFDSNWGMTFGVTAAMPTGLTMVNYEIGLRYTF